MVDQREHQQWRRPVAAHDVDQVDAVAAEQIRVQGGAVLVDQLSEGFASPGWAASM
jgi:hypothetical protein